MEMINEPLLETVLFHYIKYDKIESEKLQVMYLKNVSLENINEKIIDIFIEKDIRQFYIKKLQFKGV